MSDIVERLRHGPVSSDDARAWRWSALCNEAAAEIERLRAALREARLSLRINASSTALVIIDAALSGKGET